MKKCVKCNASMNDDDLFCPKCGTKQIKGNGTKNTKVKTAAGGKTPVKTSSGSTAVKKEPVKKTAVKAPAKRTVKADEIPLSKALIEYYDGAFQLEYRRYTLEGILKKLNAQRNTALQQKSDAEVNLQRNAKKVQDLNSRRKNYKPTAFKAAEFRPTSRMPLVMFIELEDYLKWWLPFQLITAVLALTVFTKKMNSMPMFIAVLVGLPLLLTFLVPWCINSIQKAVNHAKDEKRREQFNKEQDKRRREHDEAERKKRNQLFAYLDQEKKRIGTDSRSNQSRIDYLERVHLPMLEDEISKADKALRRQNEALEKYYSINVIYEKYRALVPVATILEYLKSGRVNRLTGMDGAYNLYEQELRQNLIIGKLDDIAHVSRDILKSQHELSAAVNNAAGTINQTLKAINRVAEANEINTQQIVSGVKKLKHSQETTNYYAELAESNSYQLLEIERWKTYGKMYGWY